MAQEATRLAELGLSSREIAGRLNVTTATVNRWKQAGKLPRTRGTVGEGVPVGVVTPGQTPAEWAAAVRAEFDLNPTDGQLVTLGEAALAMSLNPTVTPQVRMNATGRFLAVAKQLALVARAAALKDAETSPVEPAEEPKKKFPARVERRTGADPRTILMAVK